MKWVLCNAIAMALILILPTGPVLATICPYLECNYSNPAGSERAVPGTESDHICCDFELCVSLLPPCDGEQCFLQAQKFITDAGCVGTGEGTEAKSCERIDGNFTYQLGHQECDCDAEECTFVPDGNGNYQGQTHICRDC